ncbi:hypothetical protein GDO86_005088 [Hymenochirus boettgeri]|uniref:Inhibitor of nuclear factor kappa-B kinase-interacting protein n=1 Tax=Hymenochirus boettgeri TaxID=247094 RepID=A0A8T2J0G3_9PIPI|nr:hypothetical protein GDO86_005088 [Hymenochirus boettgeri]
MSNEVKQRKKGSSKESKDGPGGSLASGPQSQDEQMRKVSVHGSFCPEARTLLCWFCVAACGALTWVVYQQSQNFTLIEQKYQILQKKAEVLDELEDKFKAMSGKLEVTRDALKNLGDFQIIQQTEQLKNEVIGIEKWSSLISEKRERLEGNITALQEALGQIELSTVTISKEVSLKVAAVKTDVRRISGLEDDVTLLTQSVQDLENKLSKVEKKTIESIGSMLAGSIDRITSLKSSISRNSDRIDLMKEKLSELQGNFSDNSERLLNLESDRVKVLKAVNFANDLRPKVFTLRKDFQNLDTMINELSLRIGRLASDLMNRDKDISFLQDKMLNLTQIKSDISDLSRDANNFEKLH